jgi:cytochrome b subunit of formate dehydrogenase
MRRRARQAAAREEEVALGRGNSGAVNFFVMVGILSVIMAVTGVFSSGPVVSSGRQRKGKVEG